MDAIKDVRVSNKSTIYYAKIPIHARVSLRCQDRTTFSTTHVDTVIFTQSYVKYLKQREKARQYFAD